jgi:hypothetical protein
MRRWIRPRAIALMTIVAVIALAVDSDAASAATPIAGIAWTFIDDKQFDADLGHGCINLAGVGWQPGSTPYMYTTFPGSEPAAGNWSQADGSVAASGYALRFDAGPTKFQENGRTFKVTAPGLQLAHGRVYLTGRIVPTKSLAISLPPRVRLAVIAHPKIQFGPGHSGKKTVPNTFLFGLTGKATIAPALARALAGARCKGKFVVGPTNHLQAGAALGEIIAQLQPSAATGIGGTITIGGGVSLSDSSGNSVQMTAGDGATLVDGSLHYTFPPTAQTHLGCELGQNCVPDRLLGLPGTVTLSDNGRSTVLANLTISYTRAAQRELVPTVTATLDGSPVTVAADVAADPGDPHPPLTNDFVARVGAALGTQVVGDFGDINAQFTTTAPV